MRYALLSGVFSLVFFLVGCGGGLSQTADEFRAKMPGYFFGKLETFEVDRPFAEVAETFKSMAPRCLDVRVKTISDMPGSHQVLISKYTPTVIVAARKAELHLQERHEKGVIGVYEEPEKGHFLMVVDAIPLDKHGTEINIYRTTLAQPEIIAKAVKGWATGANLGCPDFTK